MKTLSVDSANTGRLTLELFISPSKNHFTQIVKTNNKVITAHKLKMFLIKLNQNQAKR